VSQTGLDRAVNPIVKGARVGNEGVGTLQKGLALLRMIIDAELAGSGPPVSLRLAKTLELDPAQVSRMLSEFQSLNLVEFDAVRRGYRVGAEYFRLAASAGRGSLNVGTWNLMVRRLVAELGLPAWGAVLVGSSVLTVAAEQTTWASHSSAATGRRAPVWCTAAGRALLLDLSDALIAKMLDGQSFVGGGPEGPRNVDELMGRIAADRQAGLVIARSEFEFGVVEVAVPVRTSDAGTEMALCVAVQEEQFALYAERITDSLRAMATRYPALLKSSEAGGKASFSAGL
jgi:DNA-binding IclR family transcriptional regulator